MSSERTLVGGISSVRLLGPPSCGWEAGEAPQDTPDVTTQERNDSPHGGQPLCHQDITASGRKCTFRELFLAQPLEGTSSPVTAEVTVLRH